MKVIVGLGNPGAEYTGTRHNIGREFVETLARRFGFDEWQENSKYEGRAASGYIGKEKTLLLLPDTYMNKSGKALAAMGVKPKDLTLVHDDSDIVLGSCKISFGKRSAGHKGVESVMRAVRSRDFWRVRIGIQKKKRVDAMSLVLKKFSPQEKLLVKKLEKKILEALEKPLAARTISL
ncbi:MAG: aminoacyl-tRNA hydrolase [Candidatus Ryanbacteria bacterium]|nr:aminoacyl-tRNA hydrolase [Candidatus Ryanbacteria bacterium]